MNGRARGGDAGSDWFDPEVWRALRVAVIVAHPDDEVLGCGGLLSRASDLRVVHVTDGAPRDPAHARRHGFDSAAAYAETRAHEAEAALALAGLPSARLVRMGFADQSASEHLPGISRGLTASVAAADIVLTHAYEGGHSDHDAVAFAVHAACRLAPMSGALAAPATDRPDSRAIQNAPRVASPLAGEGAPGGRMRDQARGDCGAHPSIPAARDRFPQGEGGTDSRPLLLEMPFYHADPAGWVRQRFLPVAGALPEAVLTLTAAERDLKRRMLDAHRTQADTLRSFATETERFRPAPAYDFTRLPHTGEMLYERHGWNLTGAQWLDRVKAAQAELGLAPWP